MNKQVLVLAAVITALSSGCGKKETGRAPFDKGEVLKISVYKSGEIRVGDKTVSGQDLDGLLAANARKNGVVWYYREAGEEEAPPQATEVITLIMKHKRPVSMSSKPDFSDTIDASGNSLPRTN